MSTEVNDLIASYHRWIKDKTPFKMVGDWAEINTPFLDRHNDHLQVYLKKTDNTYLLTDAGETIGGLMMDGLTFDNSTKRQETVEYICRGFGIKVTNNNELVVSTTVNNFARSKQNLVQAMLAVGDMYMISTPRVKSLFHEDVKIWLEEKYIRFSEKVSFVGKSGLNRNFDFVIPKSKVASERLIKTLNNSNKGLVDSLIVDAVDLRENREDAKIIVFFNSEKQNDKHTNALKEYEIDTYLWDNREQVAPRLAA